MNTLIEAHFREVKVRLIYTPVVDIFKTIIEEIGKRKGHLRIKANLKNGGMLELFEHVHETKEEIEIYKYSFHWQDNQGKLMRRWDNAPHFPKLHNFPHHIHNVDGSVKGAKKVPDVFTIMNEIEKTLR